MKSSNKDNFIGFTVRITKEMREQISEAASRNGYTTASGWARDVLRAALEIENTELPSWGEM